MSSSHDAFGTPLMYQFDPLSARMMPYRFIARRITRTGGENPLMSNDAFSRNRWPIGGTFGFVLLLAKWRAGQTYARCVWLAVNRIAWRIWPLNTSS